MMQLLPRDADIRWALLGQIKAICNFLHDESPETYQQNLKEILIPVLSEYLKNSPIDVKELAGELMAKVTAELAGEDRGDNVLTVVLEMAHDQVNEDNRVVALQLFGKLSNFFGKDLCEQFIALEFVSLGDDHVIRVRKECVANLESITRLVSTKFRNERLFPFFLRKSEDEAPVVRKACLDNLYKMSLLADISLRQKELTEIVLRLLKDGNDLVRIAAFKCLGPFIACLRDAKHINDGLLEYYVKMAKSKVNKQAGENEIMFACAFSLPGVLRTLGTSRWGVIKKTYHKLAKSPDRKVRKPIACSLHEVARILGPERTEKELYPLLMKFLDDESEEIRYGVVAHVADFMLQFPEAHRERLLDLLLELKKEQTRWRERELIASQIDRLAYIFDSERTFAFIVPICFSLCSDVVAFVRNEAAAKIFALVLRLSGHSPEKLNVLLENIKHYATQNKFFHRQV
eukprot:TRINITY_DN9868_c0_g1_i4.p1 TRINITY_DN9868_c0_g1~~TRINITY_DN9868_c0_g1_i4.p1  ORF type:complete len:460 (-),score=60.10 TRINITY_DN9868_c0_g1_i4:487-1866(-)